MPRSSPPPASPSPRQVARRCTLRLPLAVAARLEAWCEMHPQRPRTELIAALIESGLAEAERSLPRERGPVVDQQADSRQPIYLLSGPFAEFHGLVNKHHLQLEQALDPGPRTVPEAPYPAVEYLLGEE